MKKYGCTGVFFVALAALGCVLTWSVGQEWAVAHCQVPCGIYDDAARIARLHEDTTTIAKAINRIKELAGKQDAQSLNQVTRWVLTKEDHATHIIEVVSEYFLAQRVKPVTVGASDYESYVKKLVEHHAVIVAAMKAKQNADESYADVLHEAIDAIAVYYPR